MGCQSSKQGEHAKTGKSKLPKLETNENANTCPDVRLPSLILNSRKWTNKILPKSK